MSKIDVEKSSNLEKSWLLACHCSMQESRRSELSNNCAEISGIFSPPVQMIFIK